MGSVVKLDTFVDYSLLNALHLKSQCNVEGKTDFYLPCVFEIPLLYFNLTLMYFPAGTAVSLFINTCGFLIYVLEDTTIFHFNNHLFIYLFILNNWN